MISRNLGPEFGTAVGILYYLANTVGVSMYLVGGVEILLVSFFFCSKKFKKLKYRCLRTRVTLKRHTFDEMNVI